MRGYKAFEHDLTCRGYQYEIGKTYEHTGDIEVCKAGFHFCGTIVDCYDYYPMNEMTRICEVEAIGEVKAKGNKYVTDKITIIAEVTDENTKRGNVGEGNVGYRNSGNRNSGDRNSGNCNSGDRNSGNCNSGNCNSGDCNSGNRNSGYRNSGYCNSGYRNSGYCNSGDRNSGNCNSGNCNSGDRNSGNRNSGDRNSGYRNSGDWNVTDHSAGCFCTEKQKIMMFDQPSEWTYEDWWESEARDIMLTAPKGCCWVNDENEATGGHLRECTADDMRKWWDELCEEKKAVIRALPNYDEEKFFVCIGIKAK